MANTTLKVIKNGDIVTWTISVRNTTGVTCYGAKLAFTIPTGVSFNGPFKVNNGIKTAEVDVPKGQFGASPTTWEIGTLEPYEVITTSFDFKVDDVGQLSANVTAALTSSCVESQTGDNNTTLTIELIDPCDVDLSIGPDTDTVYEGKVINLNIG